MVAGEEVIMSSNKDRNRESGKIREDLYGEGHTMSIADASRKAEVVEATNVRVMMTDIRRKEEAEERAWSALQRKLEPRFQLCKKCKGEGYQRDGDSCHVCQGAGHVEVEADMRAIELVLKPKFPTTQINLNADLDNMKTEDLLDAIEGM